MDKKEREALVAEIVEQQREENKAAIEKINKGIEDSAAEKKKMQARIDHLETVAGRPELDPSEAGVIEKKTEVDPMPLTFIDDKGLEHKALRLSERLFEGKEDFSVGKIIRAKILGSTKGLNDFEVKALSEGVGSAGGFLMSETVAAKIIDLSRNLMCVMKAGTYTLPMESPEMRIVRVLGDPTSFWVAEHGEITESEPSLEPLNLKVMTVGALIRSSLELIEDARNAGDMISKSLAQSIALAVDLCCLTGDGVNHPLGLSHADGVQEISMGTNGGTLDDYSKFSEACEAVANYNGLATSVLFAPRSFYTLDRLQQEAANIQPVKPPQSFVDLKKFVTNQVATDDVQGSSSNSSRAYVGDFTQMLIGVRKQVEIETTRQGGDTFKKCEMLIRARMRMDIGILKPEHFCIIRGIIPA